jgi:hypothetical protein
MRNFWPRCYVLKTRGCDKYELIPRRRLYMQGLKHREKTSFLSSKLGLFLACFTLLFLFLALTIFQMVRQQTQGDAQMGGPEHHVPPPAPSVTSDWSGCLPADVKLTDIVSAELISFSPPNNYTVKKVTVEQKLTELKASCSTSGKLVDGTGREIYFFHLTGCWGNPPFNYQDILAKQRQKLEQLRQQYTVIEMTCNPSGIPPV